MCFGTSASDGHRALREVIGQLRKATEALFVWAAVSGWPNGSAIIWAVNIGQSEKQASVIMTPIGNSLRGTLDFGASDSGAWQTASILMLWSLSYLPLVTAIYR